MQLIDTRQTYLDEHGRPIELGRLVVYKMGTTTAADLFQDEAYTLPLANPLTLSSAAWASTQVYCPESATVLVQAYAGDTEHGQPMYSTVKDYEVIAASAGQSSASGPVLLETIADLRDYADMGAGDAVMVEGYYAHGDCYIREYIWDAASVATDNGGAIVSSSTVPTGRWILQVSGMLDARAFGVLPGLANINSQFRACCNWAATQNITVHIPSGSYSVATGGTYTCYAALDVALGASIACTSGTYEIQLYIPSTIRSTLAGPGTQLYLMGHGWEQTAVPVTAWDATLRGYCQGTAKPILRINVATPLAFAYDYTYAGITVDQGIDSPVTVSSGVIIDVPEITGLGRIDYQTSVTFVCEYLHTSRIASQASRAIQATTKVAYIETEVTMRPLADVSASLIDAGGSITNGMLSGGVRTILRGAISGRPGFLRGSTGFEVLGRIDAALFADADGLVNTWNNSPESFPELDMMGVTATVGVTRSGTIRNGAIGAIAASNLRLYDVNVNGNVSANGLVAEGCTITANSYAVTSGNLKRCNLLRAGANSIAPDFNGHILEDFYTDFPFVRVVGGGSVWRNTSVNSVRLIPSSSGFGNFDWTGGSAYSILFDASSASLDGSFTAYNVVIRNVKNLSGGVSVVNGTSRKWAQTGHYSVRVGENERGRATYGSTTATMASGSSMSNVDAYILMLGMPSPNNPPIYDAVDIPQDYINVYAQNWVGMARGGIRSLAGVTNIHIDYIGNKPTTGQPVDVTFSIYGRH